MTLSYRQMAIEGYTPKQAYEAVGQGSSFEAVAGRLHRMRQALEREGIEIKPIPAHANRINRLPPNTTYRDFVIAGLSNTEVMQIRPDTSPSSINSNMAKERRKLDKLGYTWSSATKRLEPPRVTTQESEPTPVRRRGPSDEQLQASKKRATI